MITLGYVVAVYPEGQSIDVLIPDTGTRMSNVQVMVPTGSSATGEIDLPDPGLPSDDTRWDLTQNPNLYIKAVITAIRGGPICLGFILPQISQMTFNQPNLKIKRHASDAYSTVDANGNIEIYHPSGTYIRIAESAAHVDLTAQDYDQLWKIAKNTTRMPHVYVALANGGSVKATIDIDPSGNITIGGTTFTCNAPSTFNGPMAVIGNTTVTGTLAASADVTVGTVSLKTHIHSDPQGGDTGEPL